MKIKKSELVKMIKEESAKKHPLSDLARRQGKTMGGNLADPEGFYALVKKGIEFSNGEAGSALKLTESDILSIIKEEKAKILSEQWGNRPETGSDLIEFAKAYAGLGDAVQSQLDEIVAAYNNSAPGSDEFMEAVYEQNPNAIMMAYDKLGRVLGMMEDDDAIGIQEALQAAMEAFEQE